MVKIKNKQFKKLADLLLSEKMKRRRRRVVSVLAAIVVFVTTYILILPAITLEIDSDILKGEYFDTEQQVGYMYPVSDENDSSSDTEAGSDTNPDTPAASGNSGNQDSAEAALKSDGTDSADSTDSTEENDTVGSAERSGSVSLADKQHNTAAEADGEQTPSENEASENDSENDNENSEDNSENNSNENSDENSDAEKAEAKATPAPTEEMQIPDVKTHPERGDRTPEPNAMPEADRSDENPGETEIPEILTTPEIPEITDNPAETTESPDKQSDGNEAAGDNTDENVENDGNDGNSEDNEDNSKDNSGNNSGNNSENSEDNSENNSDNSDNSEDSSERENSEDSDVTDETDETDENTEEAEETEAPEQDENITDEETAEDWEASFADVSLSGVFADDVVAIARTQLGYTESVRAIEANSDSEDVENEENIDNEENSDNEENGESNENTVFTRYGAWYGDPYRTDWDAIFAAFCLSYAGISSDVIPYCDTASEWIEALKRCGYYKSSDQVYTPEKGDLIFLDDDLDGNPDHTGIVEELLIDEITDDEGNTSYRYTVRTIEGARDGKTTRNEYRADDEAIVGCGSIYEAYLFAVDNGLAGDGSTVRLTAETDNGVCFSAIGELPEGAELCVAPLSDDALDYIADSFGIIGYFCDIRILVGGEEYHPENAVVISVSGLGFGAHENLTLYHFKGMNADELMTADAEDIDLEQRIAENTGNRVSFEANGFSVYGIGTAAAAVYAETESEQGIEIDNAESVEKFRLWVWSAVSGGTKVVERGEGSEITDAYTYTDDSNETWYLVPIHYFTEVSDSLPGFSFNADDTGTCPFQYAPSAHNPASNLTDAAYVKYNNNWYVRVQDTTGLSPNRSNIYYTPSNSFTLTYNGYTITFNVVDSAENPIYGDYTDIVSEGSMRYIFGAASTESLEEGDKIEQNFAPEIEGYTYSGAAYGSYTVYSVGVGGYSNTIGNTVSTFRFYGTEPLTTGQYYTVGSDCTVTLTYIKEMTPVTDVAAANSTAINLFDYWLTTRDASDYHQNGDDAGINKDRTLKFHYSSSDDTGTLNKWTGSGGGVLQGIVEQSLADGYPALSGDTSLGMTETANGESLNYLFDPSVANDYKASYRNVQGLFQTDSMGYLYYDSKENFAEFDEANNRFNLYEESGVANSDTNGKGMFFPFNTVEQAYPLSSGEDRVLNHYFGMSLTSRFIQYNNGYTNASHSVATTFEFSGDDDVWIFIDNVLVADLGGIHDAAGVNINFAHGTVTIDNVYNAGSSSVTTYFSNIFADTGVDLETYTEDGNTYTTFRDGTTHALKFFYLERGNASSNLMLKYNLTDIPDTSIYKVDQYGVEVSGATFATYKYDSTAGTKDGDIDEYGYITDNGVTISLKYLTEVKGTQYFETGVDCYCVDRVTGLITVQTKSATTYTITPAYVGTTDDDGKMVFLDSDGMAYSVAELKRMFGDYFVLREIKSPDGYRTVSDDVLLYFEGDLLQCYLPYASGVWANPSVLANATNTLYIADDYGNTSIGTDGAINYYNPTTGESTGTLFVVVLKRNIDTVADVTSDSITGWTPVYGSDETGYHMISFGNGEEETYKTQLDAILAAAAESEKLGNVAFSPGPKGMQLLFENLPGDATRYYTYMKDNNIEFTNTDPQYLIACFYTTADSVSGANTTNTVRIRTHGGTTSTGTTYSAFSHQWGADVRVSNIVNTLYFQKMDENGVLVDDAVFSLYAAAADKDGIGYYVGKSADGSAVFIRLSDTKTTAEVYAGELDSLTNVVTIGEKLGSGVYTIDTEGDVWNSGYISNAGTVTVTAGGSVYTIAPATNAQSTNLTGYTHTECDYVYEPGTGHFQYLKYGTYFLKEISCPTGYSLNHANIPVEVTEEAVYADAGTINNNVRVGNGAGYLISAMGVSASLGEIDETLSWIYTHLKVISSNTGDFLDDLDNTFYAHSGLTKEYGFDGFGKSNEKAVGDYIPAGALTDGSGEGALTKDTTTEMGAMTQYLRYEGKLTESTDENSVFDYALYERNPKDDSGTVTTTWDEGAQSYRLWTESGWSDLAIYQDYEYGSEQTTTNNTTKYTDLTKYGEISYLFSSSTFVQVTDEYSVGNLEISKTVLPDTRETFSFTLTLTDAEGAVKKLDPSYNYTIYNVTTDESGEETRTVSETGTINITDGTGTAEFKLSDNQTLVIEDLPYGAAYSVNETLPVQEGGDSLPYTTWVSVNGGARVESREDTGTLVWRTDLDDQNVNVYNVDYENALLPLAKICKVDAQSLSDDTATTLAGAKFVMYRVVKDDSNNEVTQYYDKGEWVDITNDADAANYALTTAANGELMFANMDEDGEYYLKEIKAPDGYSLLTEEIKFEVSGGTIVSPTEIDNSTIYKVTGISYSGQQINLDVYNSTGRELPQAGGIGTTLMTLFGLALLAAALVCGYFKMRGRERRADL